MSAVVAPVSFLALLGAEELHGQGGRLEGGMRCYLGLLVPRSEITIASDEDIRTAIEWLNQEIGEAYAGQPVRYLNEKEATREALLIEVRTRRAAARVA